jgi:HlyD family secretion protein
MAVEVYAEMLGERVRATVASVGELVQDPETGERHHPLVVDPLDGPFASNLAGQDVRLSVEAAATEGEVLVVPVAALFAGADGQTAAFRVTGDGRREKVIVTVGVTGDGHVAVTPVEGTLEPGDQVVVGTRAPATNP